MVRIGVLDVSACGLDSLKLGRGFSASVEERIEKTKSPTERLLKIAAYKLLLKMYCDMFSKEKMPEIIYTPEGKPLFDKSMVANKCCHFNISHSEALAVVAISDGYSLGVDVQSVNNKGGLAERIGARFSQALGALTAEKTADVGAEVTLYEINDGNITESRDGNKFVAVSQKKDTVHEFFARWTALEAVLKLDGRGFAAIGSVGDIADKSLVYTRFLNLNSGEYALSVAFYKSENNKRN